MKISIAERFRPYCHLPGTMCLLPLSTLRFQIYPCHVKVCDLSESDPISVAEIPLNLEGPIEKFTVQQDLEKGYIRVWGFSKKGFFRYRIHATAHAPGFMFVQEKVPTGGPDLFIPEIYCRKHSHLEMPQQIEKLSFGVTKSADWELVNRRFSLTEILPFWFRLGQLTPHMDVHTLGTASLLKNIQVALEEKNVFDLSQAFKNLYDVGFEGLMSCHLSDPYFKGISISKVMPGSLSSPLLLLTQGAKLIKQMLVSIVQAENPKKTNIKILPSLIPELHSGRICGASFENVGFIDLEWSKKQIRKMIFHPSKSQIVTFHFQKGLNSFRLRDNISGVEATKTCGESISFLENSIYFFDHFKH